MSHPPRPALGLLRRLDALGRAAFPVVSTALLLVLAALPTTIPGGVTAVVLPCVFFWSLFRPTGMPPLAVFCLGLLEDFLGFAPLGTGVLVLLLLHGATLRLRRFLVQRSFLVVWLVFCGLATAAGVIQWGLQSVLEWELLPTTPGIYQTLLSWGLYPVLAWVLTRAHEAMRQAENT